MAILTGSKADGVNFTEIRESALGSLGGGEPVFSKPKRKRGYHRALKQCKAWAVLEHETIKLLNTLCYDMYAPKIWNDIFTDNALSGLSAWVPHTNESDFFL